MIDDSFLILFNAAPRAGRLHAPGRRASAAAGSSSSRRPSPSCRPAATLPPRAGSWRSSRARSLILRRSPESLGDCARTYRLQLGPALGFARARAGSSRTCASSASRTSTCRRCCRRGRARRTATTSSTRRGSRTTSAARTSCARSARPGSASCSTSSRTTWRRRAEPVLARPALAREVLRRRRAHRPHRRFFDVGELAGVRGGGPRGVRDDPPDRARPRRARGSSTGSGSTTRTGSPTRAATSSGCASRASSTSGSRRSSSRASGCATGRSRARPGYEFLNDVTALFVDPAGEEPLTELYGELTGERRPFAELAARGEARAGADDLRRRGRAAAAKLARRPDLAARARRSLPRLPHLRRARPGASRTPTARRSRRCRPTSCARILLLEERGHDAFVTRFQQTTPPVMAKGVEDTAFYR